MHRVDRRNFIPSVLSFHRNAAECSLGSHQNFLVIWPSEITSFAAVVVYLLYCRRGVLRISHACRYKIRGFMKRSTTLRWKRKEAEEAIENCRNVSLACFTSNIHLPSLTSQMRVCTLCTCNPRKKTFSPAMCLRRRRGEQKLLVRFLYGFSSCRRTCTRFFSSKMIFMT